MTAGLTRARPWHTTVRAYFALTKPHIIELLLVTTVPAMVLAQRGVPSLRLMLVTLVGGFLAAGGANAINCYVDRDIDGIMSRTRNRPLPQGRIEPRNALIFGLALAAVAFVIFASFVNFLSAFLALAAFLYYVFIYTLWLKRSTPSNIVIGGAAGAFPPVIGWAAVTNHVSVPALILFAIIFFWTPPHFWALSLRYEDDYAAARVPMLPVVRGGQETRRRILLYTVILVPVTLLLVPTRVIGLLYVIAALVLGGLFVLQAQRLRREPERRSPMRLFAYSISYLALLFGAMMVDQLAQNLFHSSLI